MILEWALWRAIKLSIKYEDDDYDPDIFLDQIKVLRKADRKKIRSAANYSYVEARFKQSDLYKSILSSVKTEPLYYVPVLEKIPKRKIEELKSWIAQYGNTRSAVEAYEYWSDILTSIEGLIQ